VSDLHQIILNRLEQQGYVAIKREEYERLLNPPATDQDRFGCPYPLTQEKFGPTHREFIGYIENKNPEKPYGGLSVIRCAACHHVSFEEPIALAAPA